MSEIAYKYRLYPTAEQSGIMNQTFGCCRKVWNMAFDEAQKAYSAEKEYYHWRSAAKKLPALKGLYPYLKDVDSSALQQSLMHLGTAYDNFYRDLKKKGRHKSKFPKFKSRKTSRRSYTSAQTNNNIAIIGDSIKLPKLKSVKAVIHRLPKAGGKLTSATVSQEPDGSYYVSLLFRYEDTEISKKAVSSETAIGLDYKSDGLYVDSNGSCAGMPHYYQQAEKRLAIKQRHMSKKEKGSKNHEKARLALAKLSNHVTNQRHDFLNKQSTAISKQYSLVGIEDLDMDAMKKTLRLGKATSNNGWGIFTVMLGYKLAREGGQLIKVSRQFPSSQLCHCCGYKSPDVKNLKIRQWTCPACGEAHNRDINAAINIKAETLRICLGTP